LRFTPAPSAAISNTVSTISAIASQHSLVELHASDTPWQKVRQAEDAGPEQGAAHVADGEQGQQQRGVGDRQYQPGRHELWRE
jgi:hypothetical protein